MNCRVGCGACCIAPSITSFIPGMLHGKPAGVRCVQLSADNRCLLFGTPQRPSVCESYRAEPDACGTSFEQALLNLALLEKQTC